METQFADFLGVEYRVAMFDSEVKLGKENQFHIVFKMEIQRVEGPQEVKRAWIVQRNNEEFLCLDRILE